MTQRFLEPDWPAPPGVHAASTLRRGGVSSGTYASLNLGQHVGDDLDAVATNRRRLVDWLGLPAEPHWLEQVHGVAVADLDRDAARCADAAVTARAGQVCVVMTADCLPVLLCSRDGRKIGAAHAGWKGLANGVIQATVAALGTTDLMAWLGPAIGPQAFEVGDEVRAAFLEASRDHGDAFSPNGEGKWLGNLYLLARQTLRNCGVDAVYGGDCCTHAEPERFFSFRRDRVTGRMATLIWRE